MRRAAIFALFLLAVCAGGVWLTRDSTPVAAPLAQEAAPPLRHVVVDPTPSPSLAPPPRALGQDSGFAAPRFEAPPPEMMPSPFDGNDSPELRYAQVMLYGPDAGHASFLAAGEVYERCLRRNPANAWCLRGLVAAQNALATGDAGAMPTEPPELRLPKSVDNEGFRPTSQGLQKP